MNEKLRILCEAEVRNVELNHNILVLWFVLEHMYSKL